MVSTLTKIGERRIPQVGARTKAELAEWLEILPSGFRRVKRVWRTPDIDEVQFWLEEDLEGRQIHYRMSGIEMVRELSKPRLING